MTFKELLHQVVSWIEADGRVSYRAIKRQFEEVDDEYMEDLREAILYAYPIDCEELGFKWNAPANTNTQPVAASPDTPDFQAERRSITVMFCDLAESTKLSQSLDPEDLRDVIRAYQTCAAEVIGKYNGHVAQYLGDGLLIYFGWPRAHEKRDQRAILSGLEIINSVNTILNPRLKQKIGVELSIRIGIHTGLVVVGQMGSQARYENLATGDTVNIAARIESVADPNSLLISHATYKLVANEFITEDKGIHQLKGVTEGVRLYEVIGQLAETDLEKNLTDQKGPFLVGRDEEIGLLHRRWEQVKRKHGQVVSISGNAGIGKSGLVDFLRADVHNEGYESLVMRCSAYHQNSAYFPLIRALEIALEHDASVGESQLDTLTRYITNIGLGVEETLPYLSKLLSIESQETIDLLKGVTPQKQKQLTSDALVAWLFKLTAKNPVLVIWEDLHWADPSTLEVVGYVVDQSPTVPMLSVFTYRPQFVPAWRQHSHITPLVLSRLELSQTQALIEHLAGEAKLPSEVIAHIVDKTDGVPLFIEELTKMLLESGVLESDGEAYQLSGSLEDLAIPETLQDSLMARLDQLNRAKEIAQLGSVIGREFSYRSIRAIFSETDNALESGLSELISAELLYVRGRIPNSTYIFKHALVQDAAYNSLLKSTRQKVHHSLARFIESDLEAIVQKQPELVAHHYTEGNAYEKGVEFWIKAERFARQNSSHQEAIAHARHGLQVVQHITDNQNRTKCEIDLLLGLGASLIATKGYSSEGVGATYGRARILAKELNDTDRMCAVLWGLCSHNITRANHEESKRVGEEMNTLTIKIDSPVFIVSKIALAIPNYSLSNFPESMAHFSAGIPTYKREHHDFHIRMFGMDMGVFCRGFGSHAAWQIGELQTALEWSEDSLQIAEANAHPFSRAVSRSYATMLHQYMRDVRSTQQHASATIALSSEQNFEYYLAWGMIIHGWCVGMQDDTQQGLKQIDEGLTLFMETESGRALPYYLSLKAELQDRSGEPDRALATIDLAIEKADKLNEHWWLSEIHRLKGEYMQLVSSKGSEEVISTYRTALIISRNQSARMQELRAATSLAKLLAEQERYDEASNVLDPVIASINGGLESKEFMLANALYKSLQI